MYSEKARSVKCGCCPGTHNTDCLELDSTVDVTYYSPVCAAELSIPTYHCRACQEMVTVHPIQAGCIPCLTDKAGEDTVWIAFEMLEQFDCLYTGKAGCSGGGEAAPAPVCGIGQ